MRRPTVPLLILAATAATLTGTAMAPAATSYSVSLCTTGTDSAGLWTFGGPLTANDHGIECPAASGEPTYDPARGNRGVFVLPHRGPAISSAGDPYAEWTLVVPPTATVTAGSVSYRGGADSAAWRAYLRANGTTIAGCYPNATVGPDACSYDTINSFFYRATSAAVPAGTTTIRVGLTCASVNAWGEASSGCAGSNPTIGNRAYSAVVGGVLNVDDTTAPTGSATLAAVDAAGASPQWIRTDVARVRLSSVVTDDVGRGVCTVRLQDAAAADTATPLAQWSVTPVTTSFRQCNAPPVGEFVALPSQWGDGEHPVKLTASDSANQLGNRTMITTTTVRIDRTAPTVTYDQRFRTVPGNTRARVTPDAIADATSGVAATNVTAVGDQGQSVPVDENEEVLVPAGGTVYVTAIATDRAGNAGTSFSEIRGAALPVPPPPTTPTAPAPPTIPGGPTTPTIPTAPLTTPTTPLAPAPAPEPVPALTGCAAATRSTITTATFTRKTRRLALTGCRYRGQKLELQVQTRRRGRTTTRTWTLAGRAGTWTCTLRLRTGETPRKTRLALPAKRHSPWSTIG